MLDALKRLVASRKALLAFLGSAVALAVYFVPEFAPAKGPALSFIEAGLALLATLIAIEDSAEKVGATAAALKADASAGYPPVVKEAAEKADAEKVDAG
jgi:hypothetical protein